MSRQNAASQSSRKTADSDPARSTVNAGFDSSPQELLQRARIDPTSLAPADVLQLQRAIGNRATGRLLAQRLSVQTKLQLGPANDKYEQEADAVARQVVRRLAAPPVQRDDDLDEEIQAKPVAYGISPFSPAQPAPVKRAFVAPQLQREEQDEEDLAQASPLHGLEGGEVAPGVAQTIQRARGSGSALDPRTRYGMESAFGVDFGGVRVHTDAQADTLNRSLNARAFTAGNDIFFRQSEYSPGSSGGKELLAHELTHTVQQGASSLQRHQSSGEMSQRQADAHGTHGAEPAVQVTTTPGPLAEMVAGALQRTPVVQRVLGLPTKAEAETQAGKAGFGWGFGTTWGKFLKHLDEFRALSDDDKDGQAEKLLQLQNDMDDWLSSASRESVKAHDADKEAFIGNLRGRIKVLYFEAKTKQEVFDPIAVNAQSSSAVNRQRIRTRLLLEGLDASVHAIDRIIDRLRSAKLTTNLRPETLAFYSKAGDFKNAWQTMYQDKSPGGVLAPIPELGGANLREAAERWLGYSPFTEEQRENRPHYCGVNVFDNPKGAAPSYGRFFFVWKDSVKARATYTAFDQFKMIKDAPMKDLPREEMIGTAANVEPALAFNENVLITLAKLTQALDVTQKELDNTMYIEAVIHGGLSMDDCEELVVDFKVDTTDPIELMDKAYLDTFRAKYPDIPVRYKA